MSGLCPGFPFANFSASALDGLPPVKIHCSLLAEEAIHAALWDYAEKNGIKIEGLKPPVTDIEETEEFYEMEK